MHQRLLRPVPLACLFAGILLLTGCSGGGSKKSFQVEVTNQTPRPVTLWLTKDGPPVEDGWRAPEDLAAATGDREPKYDFAVVAPGQTGYTGKVAGTFPAGTRAIVRVYDGAVDYFKINDAAKAGREVRADHVLKPGTNRLNVVERGDRIALEPR